MSHVLVVAEKPSVARDIARVIGASARGQGCLTGNGYAVTWAIGHLVSLKEPEELDERYKRWRKEDLPILPEAMALKVLPKTRTQFQTVKKLMNSADTQSIICATDSGREGELIFRYIYEMAGCKKPFQRLWISSMTDEAIRNGFASLKPSSEYDALYESARCRSEADWLVGMNASRAFTLRYNALLSIGRVQTPTLQMLVKRRKEIDMFQPEPFFTVRADFGDYQGQWVDAEKENEKRIPTEARAKAIAEKVKGKPARVLEVRKEEKRELAPQLYDLTTLQREASSLLGMTAEQTLKTAQSLYEKYKLITYPRTDSRYLSHDMGPSVKKALISLDNSYTALAAPILAKPIPQPKRIFDDAKLTDHHAIIPTGRKANLDALPQSENKLFDLICRRLIAAFYPAYVYEALRVTTVCEDEHFVSTGTTVLDEGFKAVYKAIKAKRGKKEEDGDTPLPPLHEGDMRTVKRATVKNDQTKPPKEHTDASLLSEMEHAGRRIEDEALRELMKGCSLGTPATRAAIIERLISVGYARRKGRQIIATEKGVKLIEAVPPEIASPETTGKWEQALERIAQGEGDSVRFMEGIRRLAAFLTKYASQDAPHVAFDPEERRGKAKRRPKTLKIVCPLCGKGEIVENEKAFGCSRWREGCRFTLWKDAVSRVGGPKLTDALVKALMQAENGDLRGSTGTLHYHDGFVTFTPKKPPIGEKK